MRKTEERLHTHIGKCKMEKRPCPHEAAPWLSFAEGGWARGHWDILPPARTPTPHLGGPWRSPHLLRSPCSAPHGLQPPTPHQPLRVEVRDQVSPNWPSHHLTRHWGRDKTSLLRGCLSSLTLRPRQPRRQQLLATLICSRLDCISKSLFPRSHWQEAVSNPTSTLLCSQLLHSEAQPHPPCPPLAQAWSSAPALSQGGPRVRRQVEASKKRIEARVCSQ